MNVDGLVDLNEKVNCVCLRGLLSSISQASPLYSFQCRNVLEESRVGLLESFPIPCDHRKTTPAQASTSKWCHVLCRGVKLYAQKFSRQLQSLREGRKGVKDYL